MVGNTIQINEKLIFYLEPSRNLELKVNDFLYLRE